MSKYEVYKEKSQPGMYDSNPDPSIAVITEFQDHVQIDLHNKIGPYFYLDHKDAARLIAQLAEWLAWIAE